MTQDEWDALVLQLDAIIAATLERDVADRGLAPRDIAAGFAELAKLRRGLEPDYALPGLAAAYNVNYLGQRAASAWLALRAAGMETMPSAVLDIGAGTGATELALHLLGADADTFVLAVEPSKEMRAGAQALRQAFAMDVVDLPATLEDLLWEPNRALQFAPGGFDLIAMSAMLPYDFDRASRARTMQLATTLGRLLKPDGQIVLIEPRAKAAELGHLESRLPAAGIRARSWASDLSGLRLQRPLPRVNAWLDPLRPALSDPDGPIGYDLPVLPPPGGVESWARSADVYLFGRQYIPERRGFRPSPIRPPVPASAGPRERPRFRTRASDVGVWAAILAVGVAGWSAAVWALWLR